eukprot:1147131-Pelagomonas_calceolata.AAC.12
MSAPVSLRLSPLLYLQTSAEEACRSEGLQGDFFHACVHDTAFSGDNVFVESAKQDSAVYEEARNSLGSDGSGSSNGSSSAGHVHHPSSILLIASLLGASMLYSMALVSPLSYPHRQKTSVDSSITMKLPDAAALFNYAEGRFPAGSGRGTDKMNVLAPYIVRLFAAMMEKAEIPSC